MKRNRHKSRSFCFVSVVLAFLFSGCQAETGSTADVQAAFETYLFEFWRNGDTESIQDLFNPDTAYYYNGTEYSGNAEAHIESLQTFGGAFSDLILRVDLAHYTREGGGVATTWTGTHTGSYCGETPTNQRVAWSVNYVFRMESGRIVELWETWNEAAVLAEMGIDVSQC